MSDDLRPTYDPEPRQFVFEQIRSKTRKGQAPPRLDPVRQEVKHLSVEAITGISSEVKALPTRQLMFSLALNLNLRLQRPGFLL